MKVSDAFAASVSFNPATVKVGEITIVEPVYAAAVIVSAVTIRPSALAAVIESTVEVSPK